MKKLLIRLFKHLRLRFFCKHDLKSVPESSWYFHYKCTKCGYEEGMGNFKINW